MLGSLGSALFFGVNHLSVCRMMCFGEGSVKWEYGCSTGVWKVVGMLLRGSQTFDGSNNLLQMCVPACKQFIEHLVCMHAVLAGWRKVNLWFGLRSREGLGWQWLGLEKVVHYNRLFW